MNVSRFTRWTHFAIEHALPGSAWGTGGIGFADFDRDGKPEVAVSRRETRTAYWFKRIADDTSDCDTGYAHVYWVENLGGGERWTRHRLPDPPGDPYTGSFHSLGVADFDGDGRLEIFAGEQEDPDTSMTAQGLLPMKPPGLQERGVIWVNVGEKQPSFTPIVIHAGRPGWHDAVLGDLDGDGDIDIVTKVWNADGPNYHLDFWRNDISLYS